MVTLNNYRNYKMQTVTLSDKVNVFAGGNAQGKTNFLEALRFLSIGKSMRTPREKELIRWGEERAGLSAVVEKEKVNRKVAIQLYAQKPKSVQINGAPITRIGELMGVITTVLFSPDEIGIIKNAPENRRRFIDISLCQLSKAYFYALNRYNKILAQRNSLLKSGKVDENSLIVWDMQLAKEGSAIAKSRAGFVDRLSVIAKEQHAFLTDGKEEFALCYEGIKGKDREEIYAKMMDALKADREKDLRQQYTHSGIQTDDLQVCIDGVDVRKFGSQGQQRTSALSLKFAEVELYKQETGESPVLLLDDVLSELDEDRKQRLLSKASSLQTIITCTDFDYDLPYLKRFSVKEGVIKED